MSHTETEPDTEAIPRSLILVVDDEPTICWAFERMFVSEGHEVVTCSSAEDGLAVLAERRPDLILLDVRLPKQDGLSALPTFREKSAEAPVIILTAFGDLETAVRAVQQGATDYVTKPFDLEEVKKSCRTALANHFCKANHAPEDTPAESAPAEDSSRHQAQLVGSSAPMQQVFRQIALVADSDLSVLITGETGTGKELVAAAIHRHSPRNAAPYLPIALVALNDDLIESELFGHVQGAFTGATRDRAGVFEQAEGGTVLLDEIGDLPLATQVKLLRVLDQREYFRVGDVRPRPCNVRILAATNCDLQQAVASGTFREDLFYRLNGLQMHLPPLRERKEDIAALCLHFLSKFSYPSAGALNTDLLVQLSFLRTSSSLEKTLS
ncbi:MAG: sigma-54 dependent transcriptional regulator [Planctomycetota bacterium]